MDKPMSFPKVLNISLAMLVLSITSPAFAIEPDLIETQTPGQGVPGSQPSPALQSPVLHKTIQKQIPTQSKVSTSRIRKDKWIAYRMARDPWIGKAAAASPEIVAAICAHPGPARMLAKHRRVYEIAEADHYLCRRLTRWKGATWALIHNKYADRVIALDPEGIYRAIKRNPKVARVLARHQMFEQMVVENPDLGKFISQHM